MPSVELSDVLKAPAIKRRWIGSELSIETDNGADRIRIRSGDIKQLERFSREVEQAFASIAVRRPLPVALPSRAEPGNRRLFH